MKKLAALLTVVVALTTVTFAQGRELAGTWNFDAAKTGPMKDPAGSERKEGAEPAGSRRAGPGGPAKVIVKQTDKTITIAMGADERNALTFNLDGTESPVMGEGKGKVAWKGDKLEVTLVNPHGTQVLNFYRQANWLVVEPGVGMKMYFARPASGK